MKLLSVNQIREADTFTIQHESINAIDLMERAATACVSWLIKKFNSDYKFKIICGLGNNGADGLAIARLLAEQDYNIELFIINYSQQRSQNFIINYERLNIINKPVFIKEINTIEQFYATFATGIQTLVIDALLGTGINKPATGLVAQLIDHVNKSASKVIAIDMPSGLYADELNSSDNNIIIADYTLTFQFPKLSFMFVETSRYVGEFEVLNIGLDKRYIDKIPDQYHYLTSKDASKILKKRNKVAHKGNFGHALIIAGSYGKMGAAVLAAKASVRTGTGLLTVHVPKCGYEILQTTVPEAMVDVDKELNYCTDNISIEKYNAIGIGPGMGTQPQIHNVIKFLIQNSSIPLVFDADAINIIAENKTWLSFIPANCIFTPHLKEFERLTGTVSASSIERLKIQQEFSIKYSAYVVLKGAHTAVSMPDGTVCFNSTGNPGMAKGGSGDVLTGIITALIAQHYTSMEACILGVYLHGLAGDFAEQDKSTESMIANDIIAQLPNAFKFLKGQLTMPVSI